MEDKFKQPDLFLVMNEEEMDSALLYAEELVAQNKRIVDMYLNFSTDDNSGQYKLLINDVDVLEYILDEDNNYRFEFPMMPYYCLIFFESDEKRDCIALALPVSVWPESYDIEYIKSFFEKHNFKINDFIPKFFLREAFLTTIKPEYEQALMKQIDSPWTIRDKDTLQEALLPNGESSAIHEISQIDRILLIKHANITIDFNASVVISTRFDIAKINYSTFNFPNAIVVYTKDGKKTPIYIGADVGLEEIMDILEENGLSKLTINKNLNDFLENMDELICELMPFARFKNNKSKKTKRI